MLYVSDHLLFDVAKPLMLYIADHLMLYIAVYLNMI